jgi:hypothetical protein
MDNNNHISVEQRRYATLLSWGSRSGLVLLIISFMAYVLGWMPAHVPVEQLHNYWNLPVAEYLQQTNSPVGWAWLMKIADGDYASLIGIAWLAGCSLVCLLAIIPIYASNKDTVFVMLCLCALAVQLLAASGILHTGGH